MFVPGFKSAIQKLCHELYLYQSATKYDSVQANVARIHDLNCDTNHTRWSDVVIAIDSLDLTDILTTSCNLLVLICVIYHSKPLAFFLSTVIYENLITCVHCGHLGPVGFDGAVSGHVLLDDDLSSCKYPLKIRSRWKKIGASSPACIVYLDIWSRKTLIFLLQKEVFQFFTIQAAENVFLLASALLHRTSQIRDYDLSFGQCYSIHLVWEPTTYKQIEYVTPSTFSRATLQLHFGQIRRCNHVVKKYASSVRSHLVVWAVFLCDANSRLDYTIFYLRYFSIKYDVWNHPSVC